MNNLDEIEAIAKRSKALREATTEGQWWVTSAPWGTGESIHAGPSDDPHNATNWICEICMVGNSDEYCNDMAHIADAHNAALDDVCLSLCKEVRELRAAASVFMRHACRPGDDGRFDDAYDAAKSKLRQLLEDPDV